MVRSAFILTMMLGSFSLSAQDSADGAATGTTGGQGGQTVTVSNLSQLQNYADASSPYIILVDGTISSSNFTEVDISSNKTIVGLGTGATLVNIELHIEDQNNIIIRNLTIRDSYVPGDPQGDSNDNDGIQADNTTNLWIDHCHLSHCGDGLLDLRDGCDNVTVSWTRFSNHYKTFGIGWTNETDWEMTIHHCWFDGTITRNPSFDQGKGHLYNNYLSGNSSYGNLARGNARVIVQNSRFDNVNDPLAISDNALLYSSGNSFNGCTGSQSGNTSSMPWTPGYSYTLDNPSHLRVALQEGTGPQSYVSDQYTGGSSGGSITEGVYSIISRHSGKAMEVFDFNTSNGGNIVQWDYWGGDFQKWKVISVGGGYYRIENVGSGRSLDVESASTANGANLQQWGYGSGGTHKEFSFEDAGGGYYRITPRHSNKCLDVEGISSTNGANIFQWEYLSGWNQQWQFNRLGGLKMAAEVEDELAVSKTLVYPNPTTGKVTIALDQFEDPVNVRVSDLEGKIVFSQMNAKEIDLSQLRKGMYLINFISGKINTSEKLIIR